MPVEPTASVRQEPKHLQVKVHPGANRDVVTPLGPGRYEVWVRAKPADGEANEAVRRLLSRSLGVAPSRLRLVRGGASRQKLFMVSAA